MSGSATRIISPILSLHDPRQTDRDSHLTQVALQRWRPSEMPEIDCTTVQSLWIPIDKSFSNPPIFCSSKEPRGTASNMSEAIFWVRYSPDNQLPKPIFQTKSKAKFPDNLFRGTMSSEVMSWRAPLVPWFLVRVGNPLHARCQAQRLRERPLHGQQTRREKAPCVSQQLDMVSHTGWIQILPAQEHMKHRYVSVWYSNYLDS